MRNRLVSKARAELRHKLRPHINQDGQDFLLFTCNEYKAETYYGNNGYCFI